MRVADRREERRHWRAEEPAQAAQLAFAQAQAQALAAAMPCNSGKALEFGRDNAVAPPVGASVPAMAPAATASTLSEANVSAKSGALDASR